MTRLRDASVWSLAAVLTSAVAWAAPTAAPTPPAPDPAAADRASDPAVAEAEAPEPTRDESLSQLRELLDSMPMDTPITTSITPISKNSAEAK